MTPTQNYSKNDIILVRYPFSNLTAIKVRPAIIVSTSHISSDYFIVPITSKTEFLLPGEFVLTAWQPAGLNVPSAVKRGVYTVDSELIIKRVGALQQVDIQLLAHSLRVWLGL